MLFIKVSCAIAFALFGLQLAAHAQSAPARETPAAAAARKADTAAKDRINAWTVGIAGGLIEGGRFVSRQRSLGL